MREILPAILAHDETDFRAHIQHVGLRTRANVWHVDILDGSMFGTTSWADPDVIKTWNDLPNFELHLMVENPLPFVEAWRGAMSNVVRAIIHAEIARPLGAVIERIKFLGLETGIALNPETRIERMSHHLHDLDVLQIMGVRPGARAQPFGGEPILSKIRRARALFPELTIAVDGGINTKTAPSIVAAGATRLVSASFLWSTAKPEEVFQELSAVLH